MSEYKKPKKVEMGVRPTAKSNGGSCKLLVENTPNKNAPLCCGKEPSKKKLICGYFNDFTDDRSAGADGGLK